MAALNRAVMGDPVLRDLAGELNGQAETSALQEWEERALERYRQEYIDAGDLADAVGVVNDGPELLNEAWQCITRNHSTKAIVLLGKIMAMGAETNARYRLHNISGVRAYTASNEYCINCQHFGDRHGELICRRSERKTHILDWCSDWRKGK